MGHEIVDDRENDLVIFDETDHGCAERQTSDEVSRSVDGVDEPVSVHGTLTARLFAPEADARIVPAEALLEKGLGFYVEPSHDICGRATLGRARRFTMMLAERTANFRNCTDDGIRRSR